MSAASDLVDHYGVLGVSRLASTEEIRSAFIQRAKQVHPDAGGSHDEFLAVKAAYDLLSDPVARAEFDRALIEAVKSSLKNLRSPRTFRNDWTDLSS